MRPGKRKGQLAGLEVEMLPPERLIPYARNPRRKHQVARVMASLKEFGWRQPIVVDEDLVVVAGHARLEAALRMEMREVPVHIARDLSRWQAKAYRIADNRSAEAEWDEELLSLEVAELQEDEEADVSATGFDGVPLERLLQLAMSVGPDEDDGLDLTPPARPKSKLGTVYELGPHRLMCGSSTDPKHLRKLVGHAKVECLWTDPPYGVEYSGKTADKLSILNDDRAGLDGLLRAAFATVDGVLAPSARFYIAAPAGPNGTVFRLAIDAVGWTFHQVLVWVKQAFVLGHSDHHYQHEDVLYGWKSDVDLDALFREFLEYRKEHQEVLYGWKPGEGRPGRGNHEGTRWWGGHGVSSVFQFDRPARNADHPTAKPVELIRQHVGNSTRPGDHVLDIFAGSGSTLIAAEQLGRRALLMELDPGYCDVIRRRYKAYLDQCERSE